MSGHSKWSSIKHKKAARDAKRGKVFTKLIKEITIAARLGGGDPGANPRLRTAIAAAKAQSMPNDNIDRAIKKGTGELGGGTLEEITYEGYGPAGVAIIADVFTDNRNRVVAELRHMFSRHGGNLGESGCVAWMFKKRGVIAIDKGAADEDRLLELALEAGADDVVSEDDGFQVLTGTESFSAVRDAIEKAGIPIASAEIAKLPENTVKVSGNAAEQVLKLMEELEDHDDVQGVAANFEMDTDEMARLPPHKIFPETRRAARGECRAAAGDEDAGAGNRSRKCGLRMGVDRARGRAAIPGGGYDPAARRDARPGPAQGNSRPAA
jgi:YebC/PmpR family DNA-binding regulatory protein